MVNSVYMPEIYIENLMFSNSKETYKASLCFCSFHDAASYKDIQRHLHHNEKKYFDGLTHEKRIKSFLLGRYAAKAAVGHLVNESNLERILIQNGVFNQPVVAYGNNHNLQISITHCDEFGAAIAFPEVHPIGIDIEYASFRVAKVVEKQLTDKECNLVKSIPYSLDLAYTLMWTSKEALSKILKTGLTVSLNVLEIDKIEKKNNCIISYFTNFIQYYSITFFIDRYVCSIVCPKNTDVDFDFSMLEDKLQFIKRNHGEMIV